MNAKARLVFVACLILSITPAVSAQVSRGTVLGTVQDASSAVIPGVTVNVINEGTNLTRTVITDETGTYTVELLPVGQYRVEAELAGFKKEVRTGIELHVDQKARVDLQLTVGNVSEVIEVNEAAPLVQTEDASLSQTMDNRKIVELPLNGRDIAQLAYLIPGAFAPRLGSSLGGRGGFTIAGQIEDSNQLMLDGVNNNGGGTHEIAARVNVDAIQEFKIQTNTYGAQYGRFAGAQVDAVTKSGTNALHGNVYWFHRNDNLDARNFFDPWPLEKKPEFRRHQYGATAGGPIKTDKTFFFGGYQGQRQHKILTRTGTLPLSEFWTGDFSRAGRTITDPLTRQPFPNNRIPAQRLNATALKLREFYPAPTNTALAVQNYTAFQPAPDNYHLINGRIDHTFSSGHTIFGSYSHYRNELIEYPIAGNPVIPDFAVDGKIYSQLFSLSDVITLTPTTVNEFRAGFNRLVRVRDPFTYKGRYVNQELGLHGVIADRFPITRGVPFFNITGIERIGDNTNIPQHNFNQAYTIVDNLSFQRGSHAIKTGFDWYRKGQNTNFTTNQRGRFDFNGMFTGFGFADFILGLPSQTSRNIPGDCSNCGIDHHPYIDSLNIYFQNDWKVNPRLTLNLGVRYELNFPLTEKHNKLRSFVPETGAVRTATKDAPLHDLDKNNFAPRLGLAWRPFGGTKTVVRGGFGVFYGVDDVCNCDFYSIMPPNFQNQTFTAELANPISLSNPFPVDRTRTALALTGLPRDYRTYYYSNWSFGVQREIGGNMVVETVYEGKKGTGLYVSRNVNQAAPGAGSLVSRRPYPQWENINYLESVGNSIYHAGMIKAEKRFSQGLSFLSSYTFGKMIDDTASPQIQNNRRLERALSDFHNTHRFTASSVFELPVGAGRRFLSSVSGAGGKLLSGWEVSSILIARSGQPLTPSVTTDRSGTGNFRDRPNVVGDWRISAPTVQRWFNTAAFALPALGTFGNAGRNSLIGPGMWNFDFSLIKNTKLDESRSVQFRAEFFNAFNHPTFVQPNAQANSTSFGRIFSAELPREIQFGMKFLF